MLAHRDSTHEGCHCAAMVCTLALVVCVGTAAVSADVLLDVPYLHQCCSTPDGFDGRHACGATTAVMILAYYGILDSDGLSGGGYGDYVSQIYTYNGYTWDTSTNDYSGNPAYGAYGYIHHNADPDIHYAIAWRAEFYFEQHGLSSRVIYAPSEQDVQDELDAGHPVWASTEYYGGHIVAIIGYTSNHRFYVHDPWKEGTSWWECDGEQETYYWDDMGTGTKWIVTAEGSPPLASATDLEGQPDLMYPSTVYEVTAKYYDPDGRANLQACSLRLTHPSDTLVMFWFQETGSPFTVSSFILSLEVDSRTILDTHEGYELTWRFQLSDTWPEAVDCIDFAVGAIDDEGLESGWDIDDTNASFVLGLNPPQNVTASAGTYTDKIRITWTGSSGATHYQVYRATSSGGTKSAISAWITAASYDDATATPGQTYYYWVKAATSSSGANASDYSSYDTGWKTLSPPGSVSASKGTFLDKVRISWNGSSGASHYQVYRSTSSGGSKTPLCGWITGTTYDETSATPGTTYYYWVKAATSSSGDRSSDYSSYDTGWKGTDINPPNPNPLSWADDPDATSTTCIDMVATMATDPEGSSVSYYFDETSGNSGGSDSGWQPSRAYTDCGLSPNTEYRYQVKARDNCGNETAYSSEHPCFTAIEQPSGIAFGTITTTTIQARSANTPSNLTTAASGLSVMDDHAHSSGWKQNNNWWTDSGLSPNTAYRFSAVARNGDGVETSHSAQYPKYTLANTPSAPSVTDPAEDSLDVTVNPNGNPSHTQFAIRDTTRGVWIQPDGSSSGSETWQTASQWGVVVTGLSPGTTYEFRVKARNGDDAETDLGPTGQGTTLAGTPDAPTNVTASDGAFGEFVRVDWTEAPGATRYDIYRAPPDGGGCSDQFVLIGRTDAPPYDDTTAAAQRVHWYYVKACNTTCSDASEVDTGCRAGTPPAGTTASLRVDSTGNVFADSTLSGSRFCTGSADVAEWVGVSGPVQRGDVLELDISSPGFYRLSQAPCSTLVAGVVSAEPGVILGQAETFEQKALLALVGIVPVKVTDEGGPIQPGDLLVTSSTPGHAMRYSGPDPCPCSLVGKALEPMTDESGMILVLLTAH